MTAFIWFEGRYLFSCLTPLRDLVCVIYLAEIAATTEPVSWNTTPRYLYSFTTGNPMMVVPISESLLMDRHNFMMPDLDLFRLMLLLAHHFSTTERALVSWAFPLDRMAKSSAYKRIWAPVLRTSFTISLMYILKRMGLLHAPWGVEHLVLTSP